MKDVWMQLEGPGLRQSLDSPATEFKVYQLGSCAALGVQVHCPGSLCPLSPRQTENGMDKQTPRAPWPTCREAPVGRGQPPCSMPTVQCRVEVLLTPTTPQVSHV